MKKKNGYFQELIKNKTEVKILFAPAHGKTFVMRGFLTSISREEIVVLDEKTDELFPISIEKIVSIIPQTQDTQKKDTTHYEKKSAYQGKNFSYDKWWKNG